MRKAGLPAAVSNTAGTFVCNHILYSLMDIAQDHPTAFRGGFLHIPYVPEQVARVGAAPSMALDDIVRGIEIILEVSAARTADIHTDGSHSGDGGRDVPRGVRANDDVVELHD